MLTAIAIDDEPPALKIIENFCSEIDYIQLQKTFTRPSDAQKYIENFPVNVLFLDINMPSISGIEFYRKLVSNTAEQELLLVFTTAYGEFAVEGFNLNAVDYLLKPFTFERFLQATEKVKERYDWLHKQSNATEEVFYLRADYRLHKVVVQDIVYIECLDDYLKIYTLHAKPLVVRMTMKTMLDKLPPQHFARVHRSYIVPIQKIESIRNKTIYIGTKEIPIGTSFEGAFNAKYYQK